MGRSILAVIAGFIVWSVLWVGLGVVGVAAVFGADIVDESGTFVHTGALVTLLGLSVVCSLAAGATCGAIAKAGSPAAAWLAGLLLAVGVMAEVAAWSASPAWYHVIFLVMLVPFTLLGARLMKRKQI